MPGIWGWSLSRKRCSDQRVSPESALWRPLPSGQLMQVQDPAGHETPLSMRAVHAPWKTASGARATVIYRRITSAVTFASKYSTGGPWPPAAGGCCAAWGAALHPTLRHPGVRIAPHHFPSIVGCVCLCFCSLLNAVPSCLCGLPRHPLEPIRVSCLAASGERQSRPFLSRGPLHPLLRTAVFRSPSRHEHTRP